MPAINCYVPIKLRISGELADEQLDQLAATLVRAVSARITFAKETLAKGQHTVSDLSDEPRERLEPSRWNDQEYRVPGYDAGGRDIGIPLVEGRGQPSKSLAKGKQARHSSGRLRLKGHVTDEAVAQFLHSLRQRVRRFRDVTTGRIKGDTLEHGDTRYSLVPIQRLPEGGTISSRLGEGVYYLGPLPRLPAASHLSIFGPPYRIYKVDPQGRLAHTGLDVIPIGFVTLPAGVLVYTERGIHLAPVQVTGRRPRDTASLAERLLTVLGEWGYITAPRIVVLNTLSILRSEDVSKEELMEVFQNLRRAGKLGNFLNLIQDLELRQYLKVKGIPWEFVFMNWEPSINDSALVFLGYVAGVGEFFWDLVDLLYTLIGSPFDEELAGKKDQFWAGLKAFFEHPLVSIQQGVQETYQSFKNALWNLEFFQAGRILGKAVMMVAMALKAISSVPKIGRAVARAAVNLVRLTARELQALGLTAEQLRDLVRIPGKRLVTPQGVVFMSSEEDIRAVSGAGKELGRLTKGEIDQAVGELDNLQQEAARAAKIESEAAPAGKGKPKAAGKGKITLGEVATDVGTLTEAGKAKAAVVIPKIDYDRLVRQAIRDLKEQGISGRHPTEYGRQLHGAIQKRLGRITPPEGWLIAVEKPLSEIVSIPEDLDRMKVSEYLKANPHIAEEIGQLPAKTLEARIGALQPDLVMRPPDMQYVLWDLTSTSAAEHWAKTMLYNHFLSGEKTLVQFGESYWRKPIELPPNWKKIKAPSKRQTGRK